MKSIIVYGERVMTVNAQLLCKAMGLTHVDFILSNRAEMKTDTLYLLPRIPEWLLPSEMKPICMPVAEALEHLAAYKQRQDPVMKLSGPALKIKRLSPDAIVPQYQTAGAACFDIHSINADAIAPGEQTTFRIGLAFEVPPGFFMAVFSRSGQGFKHGVCLANGTGIIDADFRGELMVSLRNNGEDYYSVQPGDRIAQATLIAINRWQLLEVDELSETVRGANGGGSTGV